MSDEKMIDHASLPLNECEHPEFYDYSHAAELTLPFITATFLFIVDDKSKVILDCQWQLYGGKDVKGVLSFLSTRVTGQVLYFEEGLPINEVLLTGIDTYISPENKEALLSALSSLSFSEHQRKKMKK